MLSVRFRTLTTHLLVALAALVVRGRTACAAVAGIGETVAARSLRLQALMDRFSQGKLRTRTVFAPRKPKRTGEGAGGAAAAKPWPEHIPGWLHLVGLNHPSLDVRHRWDLTWPPNRRHLAEFVRCLRAFVEEDGEMRGLLGVSREARRIARWFLRTGDNAALPEILKEPKRARRPRKTRGRNDWGAPRRTKPRREPAPFETPPGDLTREERERRGMWVPEPRLIRDPREVDWTRTKLTMDPRRLFLWER